MAKKKSFYVKNTNIQGTMFSKEERNCVGWGKDKKQVSVAIIIYFDFQCTLWKDTSYSKNIKIHYKDVSIMNSSTNAREHIFVKDY